MLLFVQYKFLGLFFYISKIRELDLTTWFQILKKDNVLTVVFYETELHDFYMKICFNTIL